MDDLRGCPDGWFEMQRLAYEQARRIADALIRRVADQIEQDILSDVGRDEVEVNAFLRSEGIVVREGDLR